MKHLGLVHFLLLLGVGLLLLGPAVAQLTAYQNLMPSAEVGQMVTVTVSLTYNGQNSTQAVVTPRPPHGVVANAGGQSTELYPMITQQISYPLMAQQSGTYMIVSDISWAEGGIWRNLRLIEPFTAIASAVPQPMPGDITPDVGQDLFPTPPGDALPEGVSPHDTQPDNNGVSGSGSPEDVPPDGSNPGPDQGERPPDE